MIAGQLKIFPSPSDLFIEAAKSIVTILQSGIRTSGSVSLVLSGGATPRGVYDLLATEWFSGQIEWAKVHIFWGDERCVPPHAPDSNYHMANEVLIRKIAIPTTHVHRIPAERPPQEAAQAYQHEIRKLFQLREKDLPRFTLVLLGLGTDGHTASLFPNTSALQERTKLITEVFVESLKTSRITMTLPLINNAHNVIVLVSGKGKAGILSAVIDADVPQFPVNMIVPTSGSLTWMVDRDAASQIELPG
jgi:6-phosphogluconolactonase